MADNSKIVNCKLSNSKLERLPVGTMLQGGKYRIEGYISSGGFGNTYVATNFEMQEQVAIKEFFMGEISHRDETTGVYVREEDAKQLFIRQRRKFLKEARRLRKLRNEHVVSAYNIFEENGTAYYEMDLIKGETLNESLKNMGQPFSEQEVLIILDQLLDGLAAVHEEHLVHLDLKPSNIMVDDNGLVRMIDFGASKQLKASDGEGASTTSTLAMTPGYAPLEQVDMNIKKIGPWTDFYALGATLYKLLTTESPPSATEMLESGRGLTFPSTVSPRMQQLILWLMKSNRKERPQSVSEIREYLDANFNNSTDTMPDASGNITATLSDASASGESDDDDVEVVMISPPPPPTPNIPPPTPMKPKKKSSGCLIFLSFMLGMLIVGCIAAIILFL